MALFTRESSTAIGLPRGPFSPARGEGIGFRPAGAEPQSPDAGRRGCRRSPFGRFRQARDGAAALEFAMVSMPFILLLIALAQMAVYYMTQSSLDAGLVQTADSLVNTYNLATAPTAMTPAALKTLVVSKSGGLVRDDSTLLVELRKLSNLSTAVAPIGNTVDANVPTDILVLRAQVAVTSFMPLMGNMNVRSSAIVRRQNY